MILVIALRECAQSYFAICIKNICMILLLHVFKFVAWAIVL